MRPALPAAFAALALMLSVYAEGSRPTTTDHAIDASPTETPEEPPVQPADAPPQGEVTLAFAGDIHFERHLATLLTQPQAGLGPMNQTLSDADITMVNLESSITNRGKPEAKELEDPSNRYHFRTGPAALDVLDAAGVDVVTMANNHGADFGPVGLGDTLAAIRASPIPVVGIGENKQAAFAVYRVTIGSTDLAFLAADGSMREGRSGVWAAGKTTPGLASTHSDRARALISAVRASSREDDVVVVYMHWGAEYQGCPTAQQRLTARALTDAGADVIVGSHAHVPLGSGWLGSSYVNFGLGNFVWYHNARPDTGVLKIKIRDGAVVEDEWTPARIRPGGRPESVRGAQRVKAVADWRQLRGCTDLSPKPPDSSPPVESSGGAEDLPAYTSSVGTLGPALRERMKFRHRPGCPVPLSDLRYLRMSYVGFDGQAHIGEMVVHRDYAEKVTGVFEELYDARWPIEQMHLVDEYRGDDDRSMAANNTSAYNCRLVAGTGELSDHTYGAAIDINPVQNPYLNGDSIVPPAGREFATIDRASEAGVPQGAIQAGDVVVRAFAEIGWGWGGDWLATKDFQHFSASGG